MKFKRNATIVVLDEVYFMIQYVFLMVYNICIHFVISTRIHRNALYTPYIFDNIVQYNNNYRVIQNQIQCE